MGGHSPPSLFVNPNQPNFRPPTAPSSTGFQQEATQNPQNPVASTSSSRGCQQEATQNPENPIASNGGFQTLTQTLSSVYQLIAGLTAKGLSPPPSPFGTRQHRWPGDYRMLGYRLNSHCIRLWPSLGRLNGVIIVPRRPKGLLRPPGGCTRRPQGFMKIPQGFMRRPGGFRRRPRGFLDRPEELLRRPQGVMRRPQGVMRRPQGGRRRPQGSRR